jgi:hypothetical protein
LSNGCIVDKIESDRSNLSIIRTSWLYDDEPDNKFTSKIIQNIIDKKELFGTLQKGCITHYEALSEYIKLIVEGKIKSELLAEFQGDTIHSRKALINSILYFLRRDNLISPIESIQNIKIVGHNSGIYPNEIGFLNVYENFLTTLYNIDYCKFIKYDNEMKLFAESVRNIYRKLKEEI